MSEDGTGIRADTAPEVGALGKSIFPTFAVNVPLPADTAAPATEAPATAPAGSAPSGPASED